MLKKFLKKNHLLYIYFLDIKALTNAHVFRALPLPFLLREMPCSSPEERFLLAAPSMGHYLPGMPYACLTRRKSFTFFLMLFSILYVPLIKEMLWTYTTSDFWKVRVSFNADKQKTTQNTLLPSYTWSAFCFLNPLQLYISEYHIFVFPFLTLYACNTHFLKQLQIILRILNNHTSY